MVRRSSTEARKAIEKSGGDHTGLDYWHGMLPDEDTAILLKKSGQFLLRARETIGTDDIILSVRWGKDIVNAVVSKCEKEGYNCQGNFFTSVKDIIDLYQVRKRRLSINGVEVTLEMPVRRKHWELRHKMIKLEKELGSGSYGTVYRGTLTFPAKKPFEVAVKELSEMSVQASNALWKEARVMQMYDHPNVVKMYGVANDYMPYYLVMELVHGGSVDDYLMKKGSKTSVKARIQILYEASLGLEYLHSKNCLHRDIACRNLLIDKVVKVADFGMTRHTTNYKIDPNKPTNLRWLAPEVFRSSIVNKSTDVYAFGVTMYECFTQPYSIPYADWRAEKEAAMNAMFGCFMLKRMGMRLQECHNVRFRDSPIRKPFGKDETLTLFELGPRAILTNLLFSVANARLDPVQNVFDKVVNSGYRLQPPDLMPRKISDLMEECIGPQESRPTFSVIVVCLKMFLNRE